MFLFALPAGALADIVDRRRFLLGGRNRHHGGVRRLSRPWWRSASRHRSILLLFTFLNGVGNALTAPAWQAVTPQLVPRPELRPAVAANSVGVNISRAIGPALGGVLVAARGHRGCRSG